MDYNNWKEIPEDVREKINLAVVIAHPGRKSERLYCQSIDVAVQGILHCINVVADTSDYANGVLLQKRFSHQPWMEFGGHVTWTIRPIGAEEKS